MAFDFPSSPTNGQQVTASNGVIYVWTGVAWVPLAVGNTAFPQVFIGDSPPTSPPPVAGNLWWDSADLNGYLRYNDGSSVQWVPFTPQEGIPDAPSDGRAYVRQSQGWVQGATLPQAGANVGRNLLHNGLFNIAQRGAGAWTAQGYTLDRWLHVLTSDTISVQQIGLSDANRAAIGDEAARFAYYNNFTGNAAATAFNYVTQHIEDLRRLAGKTVTVSFWATAGSGTPRLGISIDQLTGTGGSATPNVLGNGQSVTLSTTPVRYNVTLSIGSSAGLTLGTNNDHATGLNFWFSAGTNFAVRSGAVGVQTAIIWLWGIQLEIGTQATPLEKLDPRLDLANCQRFYAIGGLHIYGYTLAGGFLSQVISLPVPMRASPTLTLTMGSGANYNYTGLDNPWNTSNYQARLLVSATAAGSVSAPATFTASADL